MIYIKKDSNLLSAISAAAAAVLQVLLSTINITSHPHTITITITITAPVPVPGDLWPLVVTCDLVMVRQSYITSNI